MGCGMSTEYSYDCEIRPNDSYNESYYSYPVHCAHMRVYNVPAVAVS